MEAKRKAEGQPDVILESMLPRKFPKVNIMKTVPQTDTGDQVE
jgi:hypothetical protein